MRVASLLPSATEIVCALGRERDLVARSADCDFPATVQRLPVVMRPRPAVLADGSAEIDRRVRNLRGAGESLYELDVELLRELRPDVVLTQELCGVCSVTPAEVRDACQLAGVAPEIVSLTPTSLDGVLSTVGQVGRALGSESRARTLVDHLENRTRQVRARTSATGKSVSLVEWIDPPILAGLWTPEMIQIAGGRPSGHPRAGESARRTSWPELARNPPGLFVVSPCSFSVERTSSELHREAPPGATGVLTAAETWLADEAYFSRPGPRLWDGLELLADLVAGREPARIYPVARWKLADVEVPA